MRLVVADAGPLHYLVLTGDIELLPKLFESVLAPQAVHDELNDPATPEEVRAWIARTPGWLEIRPNLTPPQENESMRILDAGEGVSAARGEGLAVTGTLGILDIAARRGLIDLADAFERLKRTSFYYRQGLLDTILDAHTKGKT
jgi:predicted nucleic acid-binding protein